MNENNYKKEFVVSWEEFHRDARALAWRLLSNRPWKGIISITRGGLVSAAIIARELDIRLIDTVCIVTYRGRDKGEAEILKKIKGDGDGYLLIDDLVDTGTTAKIVRDLLPKAYFATVYAKPEGRPTVDCFITEVSQDTWIVLPWDLELNYSSPLADRK